MKAMVEFMLALMKLAIGVRLWLMVLGICNVMIPLFYLQHREALVMLIAMILSFILGTILFKAKGMTRILGFMHTPLLVALYFLWKGITTTGMNELFEIWLRVALVCTSICLILDIRDVIKYFRGQRGSLI